MPHLDEVRGWVTGRLPALLAEHKVPGAAIGVYARGEVVRLRERRAQPRDRGRGDRRLGLPDRLHHQDLDRDAGHAAGRRGAARPRRGRRPLPAGLRPGRRRGGPGDHRAAAAVPHGGVRGRHLHRHRLERRLRREVRRDAEDRPAAVPAGSDVLLQQRRLLRARAGHRGAAGQAVRPGAARAPVRPARPGPRRHRRELRDLVPRRGRAPAQPGRTAACPSPPRCGPW